MKTKRLPKISLVILSFNGGSLLEDCLRSIERQDYPKKSLEVIVIDNGSTDDSVKIAKSFKTRVFISKKTDLYRNWAIAIHKSTGDLTYLIDQDIELKDSKFLKRMVEPLIEDRSLTGSFTRAYPSEKMNWITKFLSYHPTQCDPLYEFLTPTIAENVIEKRKNCEVCDFSDLEKLPAESRMMYWIKILKKTPNWKESRLFDHDALVKTIKSGFTKFAYVPEAGIYHYHAKDFVSLLEKRMRNLNIHYFPYNDTLEYRWVDVNNKKQTIRMVMWIIYANLIFPALLRGIWRYLKYHDWVLLTEPIVTVAVTDVVLFSFVTNPIGRKVIIKSLFS